MGETSYRIEVIHGVNLDMLGRRDPAHYGTLTLPELQAHVERFAAELGVTPAMLAHRYALTLEVDTLVLGVKNRRELAQCVAAAEAGPLPAELLARIDQTVDRTEEK